MNEMERIIRRTIALNMPRARLQELMLEALDEAIATVDAIEDDCPSIESDERYLEEITKTMLSIVSAKLAN